MNNTFCFDRFKRLLVHDAKNFISRFGITMLILMLLPLAAWIFFLFAVDASNSIPASVRWCMIYALLVFTCCAAPACLYPDVNQGNKGIRFAMLPASKREKFLSMALFCFVVTPIVFFVGSFTLDTLFTLLPFGNYKDFLWSQSFFESYFDVFNHIPENDPLLRSLYISKTILSLIALVAVFFFTNTVFKKMKLGKTVSWLMLIAFVFALVIFPLLFRCLGENYLSGLWERINSERLLRIGLIFTIALKVIAISVLIWWTSRRLKKMNY